MKTTKEKGDYGEKMAEEYLKKRGYEILDHNYRFQRAEVDLIVKQENTIVFVEVKLRKSVYFGQPEESVSPRKQKLLLAAANQYLYENNHEGPMRMDIISIVHTSSQTEITHYEDAFFPGWDS